MSKIQVVMKPTETNCPLVFEVILRDSTLNTRRMLKLFSLPIARLQWRALRWFLFITHYYIAQIGTPTNGVSILRQLTSIILFGNSELIYYSTQHVQKYSVLVSLYHRYAHKIGTLSRALFYVGQKL